MRSSDLLREKPLRIAILKGLLKRPSILPKLVMELDYAYATDVLTEVEVLIGAGLLKEMFESSPMAIINKCSYAITDEGRAALEALGAGE